MYKRIYVFELKIIKVEKTPLASTFFLLPLINIAINTLSLKNFPELQTVKQKPFQKAKCHIVSRQEFILKCL